MWIDKSRPNGGPDSDGRELRQLAGIIVLRDRLVGPNAQDSVGWPISGIALSRTIPLPGFDLSEGFRFNN